MFFVTCLIGNKYLVTLIGYWLADIIKEWSPAQYFAKLYLEMWNYLEQNHLHQKFMLNTDFYDKF